MLPPDTFAPFFARKCVATVAVASPPLKMLTSALPLLPMIRFPGVQTQHRAVRRRRRRPRRPRRQLRRRPPRSCGPAGPAARRSRRSHWTFDVPAHARFVVMARVLALDQAQVAVAGIDARFEHDRRRRRRSSRSPAPARQQHDGHQTQAGIGRSGGRLRHFISSPCVLRTAPQRAKHTLMHRKISPRCQNHGLALTSPPSTSSSALRMTLYASTTRRCNVSASPSFGRARSGDRRRILLPLRCTIRSRRR